MKPISSAFLDMQRQQEMIMQNVRVVMMNLRSVQEAEVVIARAGSDLPWRPCSSCGFELQDFIPFITSLGSVVFNLLQVQRKIKRNQHTSGQGLCYDL